MMSLNNSHRDLSQTLLVNSIDYINFLEKIKRLSKVDSIVRSSSDTFQSQLSIIRQKGNIKSGKFLIGSSSTKAYKTE